MSGILRLFRDLAHLHVGRRGVHRWTHWRERTWCTYCGKETTGPPGKLRRGP